MLQKQGNPLNRSRIPERREQVTPGPVRAASGIEIGLLADDVSAVEARTDNVEARLAFAEADIDALQALVSAQAATIADHEARIAALEAAAADHEARIAALEP
ncbi:hypothetical protein [Novosphingobium soli]|uniref:DUF4164 family protein n=1 Tax=Novosphingobium soli TaxID=574956 RepID=A0ABV6CVH8_9SPHN